MISPARIQRVKEHYPELDELTIIRRLQGEDIITAKRDQRTYAAANRDAINAEWAAQSGPPRTIAEHLSTMPAERWEQLNKEWGA